MEKSPGLRLPQPHNEKDKAILEKRTQIYELAKQKNPCRWSGKVRNWDRVEEVILSTKQTNCQPS